MRETKPFTATGKALIEELNKKHQEAVMKAIELVIADLGLAAPWQVDFQNLQFVRDVPDTPQES